MQSRTQAQRVEITAFFVTFLGMFALALVPVLNLIVAPLVPIPLVAIFLRHGTATGMSCLVLGLGLLVAVASFPEQIYFLVFALSALVVGRMGRRPVNAGRILAVGAVSLTFFLAVLFYGYNFYARWTGRAPTTDVFIEVLYNPERIVDDLSRPPATERGKALDDLYVWLTGEHLSAAATKAQTSSEYSEWLKKNEENRQLLKNVNRFPVGLFFVFSFAYFGTFFMLARWALGRWGIVLPAFEGFSTWKVPWTWAWGPLACFAAFSAFRFTGHATGEFVSNSLLLMTLIPYMVLAFAITVYWVDKFRLDPLLSALAYSFVVLNLKELAVCAIFDSWFDFRRLEPRQDTPSDSGGNWDDDIDF